MIHEVAKSSDSTSQARMVLLARLPDMEGRAEKTRRAQQLNNNPLLQILRGTATNTCPLVGSLSPTVLPPCRGSQNLAGQLLDSLLQR